MAMKIEAYPFSSVYTPIQPTVSASQNKIRYVESEPEKSLRSLIYCYWELNSVVPLDEAFNYTVVADGCIDIFWEVSHPSACWIMRCASSYSKFQFARHFHYRGIRFLPMAFTALSQISAAELPPFDQLLTSIAPTWAYELLQYELDQASFELLCNGLNEFFQRKVTSQLIPPDHRMCRALDIMLNPHHPLQLEQGLDIGVSPRQLRRLFNYYTGVSPKSFEHIIRFQQLLRAKPSVQSLKKHKSFFDYGYYDQAHFVKSFKKFHGTTPTKAFR